MKLLLIIALLIAATFSGSPQGGLQSPAYVAQLQPPAVGSSPLGSFYDHIDDSAADASYPGNSGVYLVTAAITAGESGTATRIRAHVAAGGSGSATWKVALYNSSNVKLSEASATVSASGYAYFTLSPSVDVVNGTGYKVGWQASGNEWALSRNDAGPSGVSAFAVGLYSAFPPDPIDSTGANTWKLCLGFGGNGTTP